MSLPPHKVGIVVDRNFGPRIETLARGFHIWVIESPDNAPYIQNFWQSQQPDPGSDSLASGITSFVADANESPEAACARIVGDVDEHHGEFSHVPPWSEFEVFGVKLNSTLQEAFKDIGGTAFENTQDGFVCRRSQNHGTL